MFQDLINTLARLGGKDLVEIAIVAVLIYHLLLLIRGTRGWQMTLGLAAVGVAYYFTQLFQLQIVAFVLGYLFIYFGFALIVIFQSEIRRALAEIGRGRFFGMVSASREKKVWEEVVLAATTLSSKKIGALIIIEREIGLKNHVERGIKLDAFLTYDLLVTIFNPASPLHDGAVVIQGDRLSAAACFLPLTLDAYSSKELGSRHRAAIGVTEESDCVAIVVSEETGGISAVYKGEISRNLDGPRLLRFLEKIDSSRRKAESIAAEETAEQTP